MMAVPTATLDRDDLAQVRAIARWQGRFSDYAVIDAVRKDTDHRRADTGEHPRTVQFGGFDVPSPDCAIDHLLDRLTVAQAVGRLSQEQRSIVEATVLGEQTIADWARDMGWLHERARRLRCTALDRLAVSPEVRTMRGEL